MTFTFKDHYQLTGKHAFLSASGYHWINYDEDKVVDRFSTAMAAARGTELHELAHDLIRLRVKLPKTEQTLNMYVNDALGLHMTPEQVLRYSDNAFGTADAIWFGPNRENTKRNLLRIHDLKTGVNKSSVHQLEVYAAFFCLEYGFRPTEIDMELRIYQNDERLIFEPDPHDILIIMNKIIRFDELIEQAKEAAL